MKILSPEAIQTLEKQAFAEGISAEALMEEAGAGMARAIQQFAPTPGVCLSVFGKGHNGGDALVTARLLSELGWKVILFPAFPPTDLAILTSQKWDAAGRCETLPLAQLQTWNPDSSRPLIILDGLLGIGSSGNLRSPIKDATRAINNLRENSHAQVFALDLPTGLDGLTGLTTQDTVIADVTLTVGFAKPGLVQDGVENVVGRLVVIPIHEFSRRSPQNSEAEIATPQSLAPLWKRRPANIHKGHCGRVSIVAGNEGTVGAAALATLGALRAGAGLVTLWVPEIIYGLAVSIAPVEAMVRPFKTLHESLEWRSDVLAIGPGLGLEKPEEVLQIIRDFTAPAVLDADALTILASSIASLDRCQGPRLLTPHPGEMNRLAPDLHESSRPAAARIFAARWPVTLLLKGTRTLVATQGEPLSFNPTGNPGMASGGMGDVLTGVCAALLAQNLNCHNAARLGAWLCGRAAEALVNSGLRSEESLLASDLANHLGAAFQALRQRSA